MSKLCFQCGAKLDNSALYCTKCGASQPEQNKKSFAENMETVSDAVSVKPAEKSNHKKFVIVAAVLFIVCVITMVGCGAMSDKEPNKIGMLPVEIVRQELDRAFFRVWDIDNSTRQEQVRFEIKDVDEENYDQTFSYMIFLPMDEYTCFIVNGYVKDGYVIDMRSTFLGTIKFYDEADESQQQWGDPAAVIWPICIFEEEIDTLSEFKDFLSQMENVGIIDDGYSSGNCLRIIEENAEYTHQDRVSPDGLLHVGDFNIRYLPAFSTGFLEESDYYYPDGEKPESSDNVSPSESSSITKDTSKPAATKYPEEVEFVLNRNIFVFKNEFPELYTATIKMDQSIAYVEDWNLGQILNEDNFEDIEWKVSSESNNTKIVSFTGSSRIAEKDNTIMVQFIITDGAKIPIALSLYTYVKEDQSASELSMQQYMNIGMDYNSALVSADAGIACMLTIMSESAATKADEYISSSEEPSNKSGSKHDKTGKASLVSADTWYELITNDILLFQNAEIDDAVSTSKGSVFMVTYYPVCKNCHVCGPIQMTGVGTDSQVSETYYCQSCGATTYSRFKIEY